MQALEKKKRGNLTGRYAKKKKRQDLVFHSTGTIQDVDGRALRSQGVKEKKRKEKTCVSQLMG